MTDFLYNNSEFQMDSKLILCIEEHDSIKNFNSVDTRLFIGWSNQDQDYYVRGKREDIGSNEFVPYALRFEDEDSLYDFIEFVVGLYSCASIVLYNYNNIDSLQCNNDDELTYEFFEEHMDTNYVIAAYDEVTLTRRHITKYLKMLKNSYNWERKN